MTILLTDDHAIIRLGLEMNLLQLLPQAHILTCERFEGLLQRLDQQPVELILLDIDLPDSQHTAMIEAIRQKAPRVRILIYSVGDELRLALPYIQAGADGYLTKQAPFADLQQAVSDIMGEGKYVSQAVQQLMLSQWVQSPSSAPEAPSST